MQYIVRSVARMSGEEVRQYIALFNKTFGKDLTAAEFYFKFARQFGDASHFALMVDETDGIVGSVGAIEVRYLWQGRSLTFGLTVDGMIDDRHRGNFLALTRLHNLLTDELTRRHCVFIFTKPNQNSYLYLKKLLRLGDIGNLHAYVLPLRMFRAIDRRLAWLDLPWLSVVALLSVGGGAFAEASLAEIERLIPLQPPSTGEASRPRDAEFLRRRYGSPDYRCAVSGAKFVVYRVMEYEGRHACFILEAVPLALSEWMALARYLRCRHACLNALLRVDSRRGGFLPFLRVPPRFLPDKLNIIGKVLDASAMPAEVTFSMRLSDFEVV
jgi:hypothetical protein